MGSFNTTCFVSQQIIAPEDRAYLFPIVQNHSYRKIDVKFEDVTGSVYGITNSTCYATAFWVPVSTMIEGTYDDYGGFKLVNTEENVKTVLEFFNWCESKLADVEVGEN